MRAFARRGIRPAARGVPKSYPDTSGLPPDKLAGLLVAVQLQFEFGRYCQRIHHHEAGPGRRNVAHRAIEKRGAAVENDLPGFQHALTVLYPAFAHTVLLISLTRLPQAARARRPRGCGPPPWRHRDSRRRT